MSDLTKLSVDELLSYKLGPDPGVTVVLRHSAIAEIRRRLLAAENPPAKVCSECGGTGKSAYTDYQTDCYTCKPTRESECAARKAIKAFLERYEYLDNLPGVENPTPAEELEGLYKVRDQPCRSAMTREEWERQAEMIWDEMPFPDDAITDEQYRESIRVLADALMAASKGEK